MFKDGETDNDVHRGMGIYKENDTQMSVHVNQWNTLSMIHSTSGLYIGLNENNVYYPLTYPEYTGTVVLTMGVIKGVPGSSFVGRVTGLQWINNITEPSMFTERDWYDYVSTRADVSVEVVRPYMALNIGVVV